MSQQPSSARMLGNSLFAPFVPAVRCLLSALPGSAELRKLPTPKAALRCESALLTVVGALYVLAPLFVLRSSLLGAVEQQDEASACADSKSEEAIGALLLALIQAIGGLYLLTASLLCTAAEVATKDMLLSLSTGHLLNAVLYLCIVLNFSLPGGSFGLSVASLLLHAKLSAVLYVIARKQQTTTVNSTMSGQQPTASDAKRGAGTRPSAAQLLAQRPVAGAEEVEVAEQDEGEEEDEAEDEQEAKRGALANKAFAASLSKRM